MHAGMRPELRHVVDVGQFLQDSEVGDGIVSLVHVLQYHVQVLQRRCRKGSVVTQKWSVFQNSLLTFQVLVHCWHSVFRCDCITEVQVDVLQGEGVESVGHISCEELCRSACFQRFFAYSFQQLRMDNLHRS